MPTRTDSLVAAAENRAPAVPADEARKMILRGDAPAGLRVRGHLDLARQPELARLPDGLQAASLDLSGCVNLRELPRDLQVTRLDVGGCAALTRLPAGLRCFDLNARDSGLVAVPADLRVENRLDLSACKTLRSLPDGLKVGTLVLAGCTALMALPEELEVFFLDLTGCTGLRRWPQRMSLRGGRLTARNCPWLTELPEWMTGVAQLDVSGCERLARLPEGLRVRSWVDVAGTRIASLPDSLAGVRLRWRGVLVDERVVFRPATLAARDVLRAPNAEVRRVMLERMGYERFLAEADAQALDGDTDPGGERRLLRVPLQGDEDLVCLAVFCPSTGRQYVLRVPPDIRTCRAAAAWIAGFDDPDDYRPLAET